MDQSRYRDKSYLVTYELTSDIFEMFNLKINDIVPVRSVFILYTDSGTKILKKVSYGIDELEYINSLTKYVYSNGYKYVVPFMDTVDSNYYIKRDDGIYVVLSLIEGREADFQNPIDVASVSKALCKFHLSTRGIPEVLDKRNNLYKWIPSFIKRGSELLKFKEIAELHQIKSGFDKLFLEYIDRYYNDAKMSVELLEKSNYKKLCDITLKEKNICHHDLAYHNIIFDNNDNVYFVDFDYSILDIRVHDIGNLIVKSIKNCGWDIEKAENVIRNYSEYSEIKNEELGVLYGFLTFPQDFYEISKCYYMKTKCWDEDDFESKFETKAGYYNDRKAFLDKLAKLI